ncbi:MAG: sensor histidine kinase [Methylocystaceae bacterium]
MGSGIFRKLFITNVAIVLVVLLAVALSATLFANWYYQNREQQQLKAEGAVIKSQVKAYLNGDIDLAEVQQVIDALASTNSTRIMVLEARPDTAAYLQQKLGQVKSEKDITRIYTQVLQGKEVVEKRSFFLPYQTSVLLLAQPVIEAGAVKAVVFLYTPLQESADTLKAFYRIIWSVALAALLAAAALVYTVSRRISKPLTDMAFGARAIARGETVADFAVDSHDEIADLAVAFNQMNRELAQTEQIRRDLITDVSHELRTPLTSIRGFIQAILDGVVAPEQEKKYLKLAYEELQRITKLVQDLLDLSRLRAGTAKLDRQCVDLGRVVERAAAMLEMQAGAGEITIQTTLADDVFVLGDRDRLGQVAINLLQNAVNYSPASSQVQVEVKQQNQEAVMVFRDAGTGIDIDELPYIFDRFKRGTNSVTGGTGVGLAIVKAIVEMHSGKLEADSAPGVGTEIRVLLPLFTDL